jgi:hypothetical protein
MKCHMNRANKMFAAFVPVFVIIGAFTGLSAQGNVKQYERQRDIKKLMALAQDAKTQVFIRQQAACALGRLKDARAINPLIACLQDKNIRKYSSWALGNIGDKKAIAPLLLVLTDASSLGREEAAQALNKLGWEPTNEREKAYSLAAKRDWDGCVDLGSPAIEPLVHILNDGSDNVRIGAAETLARLGWKPGEDNKDAYNKAIAWRAERGVIIENIVAEEMKLKEEYENNLQKLREDFKAGRLDLLEEEFRSLEERFNLDIMREQEEIGAFRSELNHIEFTVTRFGEQSIIGTELAIEDEAEVGSGLVVYEQKRNAVGMLAEEIWRSPWTNRPIKIFVWDKPDGTARRWPGRFYRIKRDGDRSLFAEITFNYAGEAVIFIDILFPDGQVRERISFTGLQASKISTKIGETKWIDWPGDIKWAKERLRLLEAVWLSK